MDNKIKIVVGANYTSIVEFMNVQNINKSNVISLIKEGDQIILIYEK